MRRSIGTLAVAAALLAPLPGGLAGAACASALPPPYGGSPCPGVRPGALVETAEFGGCTLGFLFQGSDKRRYAATAGHCGTAEDTEQAWAAGKGPVVTGADGRRIGQFAYAVSKGDVDFGLIRLDPGVASNPQVCHFGGPTGINLDVHTDLIEVRHYGQGLGEGVSPARTAQAPFGLVRPDYTYAWGAAYFGDSGSPVLDADGRVIGIVTELKASGLGDIGINRVTPRVAAAQARLRIRLTLLTAPVL